MPDEISSMGKTHGNASLLCKKKVDNYKKNTRKTLMQSIKGRRQKNLIQVCT
jgi:hypothetical protein